MPLSRPTADVFLTTVKKSGLVEPERLQKLLAELQAANGDVNNSAAIADFLVEKNLVTRWQAEKLLLGKHKGYFLGKYRLLSLLGKGGMSSVFLAEHVLMRRRCAIKVLPTKRVADSSYLARFHREAQAVAALDHPNIVRAYDVDHQTDKDAEIHFLVMEYVEGDSLQDLVDRGGPLGFADAANYIRQAALGLEHAHQEGMVHRDIKPGNLLVDPGGTVKLLDLGLARYFSSEEKEGTALTIAHDEKVLGTADYLAPEQALDSHTVDHRADLYSLGCTFYFLLTGHPPFTEGTLAQRLMAHQTKDPPPVEKDRPDTPPTLAAILRTMMEKLPEKRPATSAQVAETLLHWLDDHADNAWKKTHPKLFGGLRSSDTKLSLETKAEPARVVPVTRPVMTTKATDEDADTQIVSGAHRPQKDLAASSATEPELPVLIMQMAKPPLTEIQAKSTLKSPAPKRGLQSPSPPAVPPVVPVESAPNFDFLTGGVARAPSPPQPVVVAAKPAASPPAKSITQKSASSLRPTRTPDGKSPSNVSLSPQKPPLVIFLATALIGIAVLVAAGAYFFGSFGTEADRGSKKHSPKTAKSVPWTKRVIRVYGDDADYQSLQEALLDARKRFQPRPTGPDGKPDLLVIEIAAGTHRETVKIDASKFKTTWPGGIVVRGNGKVILEANSESPVIDFREVTGLTLENLTIDAGKSPIGVTYSGYATGSRLANIRIRGFTEAGLLLRGIYAFGQPEDEFQVRGLRLETKSESAVGIRIEPFEEQGKTDESNHITITGCRFHGPLAAGAVIQGNHPYDIGIQESMFVRNGSGIRFEGAGTWKDIRITNNSFFECSHGIVFTKMPDAKSSGLWIRRNLFVGTLKSEAVVQTGYNEAAFQAMFSNAVADLEGNWSDRPEPMPPPMGEVNLFANQGKRGETGFALASSDPKSDSFLAPTAASPQRSAPNPAENEKARIKPWIGAAGP